MAGKPSMAASMAADMVPEYSTLTLELEPWLMPLTTKSGCRSFNTWCLASFTQSAGVPEHSQASTSSKASDLSRRRVLPTVMACPMPDCGLIGRHYHHFANFFHYIYERPDSGAVMPSSLDTNIRGLDIF